MSVDPISLAVAGGVLAVAAGRAVLHLLRRRSRGRERLSRPLRSPLAPLTIARLIAPEDVPSRLAEDLRQEPEAGVRLQRLLSLVRDYPEHPETRRALLAACRDPDDEVCLRAALALGDEGHNALHMLAENGATSDACAAQAIAALGDRLPTAKTRILLERNLRRQRKETTRACLESLARPGRARAVQDLFLRALRDTEPEIAMAAASALGQVGTIDAVGPLRELASARLPTDLRAAARQAIAEIQSRLTGAAPGQLSLAGGEAGALSLTDEGGQISLAPGSPGGQGV